MITRVRYLNTKFADDPTDPAQLIAHGARQSKDFQLKRVLWRRRIMSYFSILLVDWKVFSCASYNRVKFSANLTWGSGFPKEYFPHSFHPRNNIQS